MAADLVLPFDDFEDGDLIANTGVRWQAFTNGVSTGQLARGDSGADNTAAAARFSGELKVGAARGPRTGPWLVCVNAERRAPSGARLISLSP
jgi:hypothetical protein